MMRLTMTFAAVFWTLAAVSPAGAQVLGRRAIGIGIGTTWVGGGHVDESSLDFGAKVRLPLGRHVDAAAFHKQAMIDGTDPTAAGAPYVKSKSTEYGIDLVAHLLPQRSLDPFVSAGLSNAVVQTTVDGRPTFADEDLKFNVGGGAEVRLGGKVSLTVGAAYQGSFRSSYGSEVTVGVSFAGWVTDVLMIGVGVDGYLDAGDAAASARVSYGF